MIGVTIAYRPKDTKIPRGINGEARNRYFAGGKVTVGWLHRLTTRGATSVYLPRIRGRNFKTSRNCQHPGYRTADQAYCCGVVILNELKTLSKEL